MLAQGSMVCTALVALPPSDAAITTFLVADLGTFALSGKAALFSVSQSSAPGSFALTGQSALFNTSMATGAGAFVLSGKAAILVAGLEHGSFALTGQSNVLTPKLTSGAAAFTVGGQSAASIVTMVEATGVFTLNGQIVALTPLTIPSTRRPLLRRGAGTFWRGVS